MLASTDHQQDSGRRLASQAAKNFCNFTATQLCEGSPKVSPDSILADVLVFVLVNDLFRFTLILTGPALGWPEPLPVDRAQLKKVRVTVTAQHRKFNQTFFVVKQQQHFRIIGT